MAILGYDSEGGGDGPRLYISRTRLVRIILRNVIRPTSYWRRILHDDT